MLPEGTVKLRLLGADGGPKVGNDRRIGDRIRPLQALATARTGSVWGGFVQSKLNVTVPIKERRTRADRRRARDQVEQAQAAQRVLLRCAAMTEKVPPFST